jgi:hypothetical protein
MFDLSICNRISAVFQMYFIIKYSVFDKVFDINSDSSKTFSGIEIIKVFEFSFTDNIPIYEELSGFLILIFLKCVLVSFLPVCRLFVWRFLKYWRRRSSCSFTHHPPLQTIRSLQNLFNTESECSLQI